MIKTQDRVTPLWVVAVLATLIFLPLFGATPNIWPDTAGYLNFASIRPPVYPLFLWAFHAFGQYQLQAVMWAQAVINFFVFLYTFRWLYTRLNLSRPLILIVLLVPILIFILHFEMLKNMGTEAVAFPLFILTFTLFVDCFTTCNLKKILFLMITINLLIMTREQFYYFYPLLLLLIGWYVWKRVSVKKFIMLFTIIVLSIFFTSFANHAYHYLIDHKFKGSSGVGELLITQGLYLADRDVAKYINKPLEKNIFEKIIRQLEAKQLTRQSAPVLLHPPLNLETARMHYDLAHDEILLIAKMNIPTGFSEYDANDIFLNINKTLYLHAIKDHLRLYIWRAAYFVGGIWIFSTCLIILLAIMFRSVLDRKWEPTEIQIFITVAIYVILANAAFVPLFAHFEMRFCYYSYFLYLILGSLVIKEFFKNYAYIRSIK